MIFMTHPPLMLSEGQCDAETVCRISNVGVVTIAVRRPHIARVILPGPGPNDMRRAAALDPWRAVRRSALIILVPTVLYPLIDAATHVIQPERIRLETADLDRLLGGRDVSAILAIGHAGLKLVAPPVLGLRASTRGIFPFGFAWEPICLSGCAREPGHELLGIAPADIGDRRVILAGCHERTCFRRGAFVTFANRNRILTDRKRLDAGLVGLLLRSIVIAAHGEAAATHCLHLGLPDRCGQRCGGGGGEEGVKFGGRPVLKGSHPRARGGVG